MTILKVMLKKLMMRIIYGHDGSYLVVSRGETRLPRSLSVRNDENFESYAEEIDDKDYICYAQEFF